VCDNDARLGIRAAGFWGTHQQNAFFDVRVFNSLAPSNRSTTLSAAYCKHEQEKRRAYEERVCEVEHGCFTPLVFSASSGMGKAATIVYKHLANMLSVRCNIPYPHFVQLTKPSQVFVRPTGIQALPSPVNSTIIPHSWVGYAVFQTSPSSSPP